MANFHHRNALQEHNTLGKSLIKQLKRILLRLGGSKFAEFCEIHFSICLTSKFLFSCPFGRNFQSGKMKVLSHKHLEAFTFQLAVIHSYNSIKQLVIWETYKYRNTHLKLLEKQ